MGIDDSTREAYDALHGEEDWAAHPDREYLEWPAVRSLLPDLDGARVLDAGCGDGAFTARLCDRCGEVVGIDASETAVREARARLPDDAEVHHGDLPQGLDRFESGSFDLVCSQLVLGHVEDWRPVFAAWFRLLRPGGHLVFSTDHPVSGWVNPDEATDYWATQGLEYEWDGNPLVIHRRPVAEHLDPLLEAGFVLERYLEPAPDPAYEEVAPERYEKLATVPRWEVVRARKPERTGD